MEGHPIRMNTAKSTSNFSDKIILKTYEHDELETFLETLSTEEQRNGFEEKEITIKPLDDKEIKDVAMRLLESGYHEECVFGKTLSEKRDIIRNNKEMVLDLITNCSQSNFINMT